MQAGDQLTINGEPQTADGKQVSFAARAWPGGKHRVTISPRAARWLSLLAVVAISGLIMLFRRQLAGLAAYGYPGLFLVSLLSSATLFLPVPGLALTFAAGTSFVPVLVGLAAGTGAAIGEITGYLAGFSGRGVIENQARYERIQGWMQRYGIGVIFVLSLIPNPLFDLAGITAGVMRIPVWRFLLVCLAGNIIKCSLVAYAGANTMILLEGLLAR